MQLSSDMLISACGDHSFTDGISIRSVLEPIGGAGSTVKPATYAGGKFQHERRWRGEGDNRKPIDAISIDNNASQANRLETALERFRSKLRLPVIELDLTAHPHLPPHVSPRLSSFQLPHRNADAYLRDARYGDTDFRKTDIGKALFFATARSPEALLQWMPQALLFGFWQSHLGNKGPQTKLARSWTSEIIGYGPAATDIYQLGLKGDPLNLTTTDAIAFSKESPLNWEVLEGKTKAGKQKASDSLAEVGHGQVPVKDDGTLAGVSFAEIEQLSTVSFAGLRNLTAANEEQNAAMRALLTALGIVAHLAAFGRGFTLRSGASLRTVSSTWTWLDPAGDQELEIPTIDEAMELLREVTAAAEQSGLPVGSAWAVEPLVLTPNASLMKVIASTFPEFEL